MMEEEKVIGLGVLIRIQFTAIVNVLEEKGIMTMDEFLAEYGKLEKEELEKGEV